MHLPGKITYKEIDEMIKVRSNWLRMFFFLHILYYASRLLTKMKMERLGIGSSNSPPRKSRFSPSFLNVIRIPYKALTLSLSPDFCLGQYNEPFPKLF